jgi:hypothetical protein
MEEQGIGTSEELEEEKVRGWNEERAELIGEERREEGKAMVDRRGGGNLG